MKKIINDLYDLIEIIAGYPCNHDCDNCLLGKQMIPIYYNNKTICDIVNDIYETLETNR